MNLIKLDFLPKLILIISILLLRGPIGSAADTVSHEDYEAFIEDALVIKKVRNQQFLVPPDLPIRVKDSVIEAMPIYEYNAVKIYHINQRLAELEKRIEELEDNQAAAAAAAEKLAEDETVDIEAEDNKPKIYFF